jgi:excisionase family DNA binding protein
VLHFGVFLWGEAPPQGLIEEGEREAMTVEPSPKREYLTTPQASKLANLSANYIATLLRRKKLEGFQLGRDWFVYTDSLNQFLQATRKPGPKGPRGQSSST